MNQVFEFICPQCKAELYTTNPTRLTCENDGLVFECLDGIWRFILPERRSHYAQFIREYETVRQSEGRGATSEAYYQALPYDDLSRCRTADWRIRAVSFDAFLNKVLAPLESLNRQPLTILDLGAGNCWLSNRLAQRGHNVTAVDLSVNDFDGLGCHRYYDATFISLEAEFSHLPIPDYSSDLIVFNASLHYSEDYETTLSEARRVLRPHGKLVIVDSPIYHNAESGRRMVEQREAEFTKRYGFPSNALKSENYLTYERIKTLGETLGIKWRFLTPSYALRWRLRPLKAWLLRRREPAKFQIIIGHSSV
jgi:SAM-dependent methyltransferase